MTRVTAYPRVHACLFDLGLATPRQYGGVGMAITGPPTIVTAELARRFDVSGLSSADEGTRRDVDAALERLKSSHELPPVSIVVSSMPPQHLGLGTKTSLVLAVLTAASRAASLDVTDAELQLASGRGGTSGVGVHTFFNGGMVTDGGHRTDPPRTYRPSSSGRPGSIPPLLGRIAMPTDWSVTLLVPEGLRRAGTDEESAFVKMTPVPDDEVRETIALAVMGLAASAACHDLGTFATSLRRLQHVGFKAREISTQTDAVGELLDELAELPGCAVGMSSMGPLLFAVSDTRDQPVRQRLADVARARRVTVLGPVSFRNQGFDLA